MTSGSTKCVSESEGILLIDLQVLLEKQLRLAQKGDITGVESIGRQADSLIKKIVSEGVFERKCFRNKQGKLQRLYERLSAALSTQKAEMAEQLNQIRKGRKTLGIYRKSI